MKRHIYSAMIIAAAAIGSTAQAQQTVTLKKGDVKVETVKLADGDYLAFGRPEGVPTQRLVEIVNAATTKNSIKYTILGKTDDQLGYQMVISKSYLELFLEQYMGLQLSTITEEDLNKAFSTLFYAQYGFGQQGTYNYTMTNGEERENGETAFVLAGEDYYIVTCDLVKQGTGYALGNDMSYQIVKTPEAGQSSEKLDVRYDGLDDSGQAMFSVTPSSGIKTLHMVLATTKSVDQFENVYGYGYIMSALASNFTAAQWNELKAEDKKWDISKEADYSFLVLGVDNNGDWVRSEINDLHIKPIANDNCPALDTESFSISNGALKVSYSASSKTSSPITKATVLVMKENDWDDQLNELVRTQGYEKPSQGWPTLAAGDKAVDVTEEVKSTGKYTFTKNFTEEERGWYVVVFAVTDENGTTITRTSFHTHIDNAETETISHTYPVTAKTAEGKVAAKKAVAKTAARRLSAGLHAAKVDTSAGKVLTVLK